jgi:hypothetical protein
LRLSNVHFANAQTVGIWVFFNFKDMANHHVAEKRRDGLEVFDFQTRHGQRVSQLLGGKGWVTKFAQPRFRKLHEYALRRSLKLA